MHRKNGEIVVILCLILSLAAGVVLFKPKFLDGDSRRAAQSQTASATVEATVKESLTSELAKGAAAAASVQAIANAAPDLPPSPATDFIRREVGIPLALLPKPDYQALLEAEKRRVAYMDGKLEVANKLYSEVESKNIDLIKAKEAADLKLQQAFIERRAVDSELSEVAAARLSAEHQRNLFILVAVILTGLWFAAKFYGVSPKSMGAILADIRNGTDPTVAFDTHTYPHLQDLIKKASKLAS